MFLVKERPTSDRDIAYPDDEFLNGICNDHPFSLNINLSVYGGENSQIYLQLGKDRRWLIVGFPRCMVPVRYPN
jgi:hypothetical protein